MLTFFTDFAYRKLKTSLYFSPILILKTNFMKLFQNAIIMIFLFAFFGCEDQSIF